ncbi:MAG: penicillin acylase family protein [Bacteroidota bacterium]
MRWILLAVSALCLSLWIFFGNYPGPGGLPVPALGSFIYPTTGFWRNARPQLIQPHSGQIELNHPDAKGTVVYDDRGVPHIFAPNLEAAVFLQGYVTAKDRLWQMDISTRSTGGRLAEVLGKKLIERDRRQIRHGYRAAARNSEATWQQYFPEDYALTSTYTAGINAFIAQLSPEDYPLEFKLLDYAPEPWSVYKSALVTKGMSQSMTDRWTDAQASKALQAFGPETYKVLFPEDNPRLSPIVPNGTPFDFAEKPLRKKEIANPSTHTGNNTPVYGQQQPIDNSEEGVDETAFPFSYHPQNGSNNWVVAGSKSATGKPILASDPHLNLTLPSIWYEVQIHTPELNCRGVSLPGLPLIVIGFNDHIAWGMTNGSVDVTDWYTIDWVDEEMNYYTLDSVKTAVNWVSDTMRIKGEADQIITTPWTHWGPVPEMDTAALYYGLAKQQVSLFAPKDRRSSEISAVKGAMAATNYTEFRAAMSAYYDPIMNFAYGDRAGNISLLSNGYYPLRPNQQGRFAQDGSLTKNDWQGYIPYEHLPESFNPKRGFVSSANQRQTDTTYPYHYVSNYSNWRSRIINRRLSQLKDVNQRSMKELQLNAYSVLAEDLLPLLLAKINRQQLDQEGKRIFQLLSEWNYTYTAESQAASYFEVWRRKVYGLTVDELGRENGLPYLTTWNWINLIRERPNHNIFDIRETDSKETAAILAQRAFDEMLEEEALPNWSQQRGTHIRHLGLVPGFGSDALTTGGHFSAPNAINTTHGPSWRMVVELGENPRAWGVLPGGPSGNPASPLYEAGVSEWAKGRYYELNRWNDLAEAEAKGTAILTFE